MTFFFFFFWGHPADRDSFRMRWICDETGATIANTVIVQDGKERLYGQKGKVTYNFMETSGMLGTIIVCHPN